MQAVTSFFTDINNIVPIVLFALLSPGLLLTIPPSDKGVFFSGQSNRWAIVVHTLVYAIGLFLFKYFMGGQGGYY